MILLRFAIVACVCAAAGADEPAAWREVTVRLGEGQADKDALSELYLYYEGRIGGEGRWRDDCLGFQNEMEHDGAVTTHEAGGQVRLDVKLTIHGRDPTDADKKAELELTLKRQADELEGQYKGTLDGKEIAGKAAGRIGPIWPTPVARHAALKPNEHPRLMFRRADLPALRRRAATEAGQLILGILKQKLAGPHSTWHGAGYGFLYQITGERKYADLGRKEVEKDFAGAMTAQDTRYSWASPGGAKYAGTDQKQKMRAGPSYAAVALAYDLCHDAWDEAFRRQVATAIQEKLDYLAVHLGKRAMPPTSNHYGCWNGGGGLANLGIVGDAGTDEKLTGLYARIFERRARRLLTTGFGDHGWFHEGHACATISTSASLIPYLQALRVATGKDMVAGSSAAAWLFLRWGMEIVPAGGSPHILARAGYGSDDLGKERSGTSYGGQFSEGFGICPEPFKPAMLWVYNRFVQPGRGTYDTESYLPIRCGYALVNWPFDVQPRDPAEVFPRVMRDERKGYFVFRNRWQDGNDITVTVLLGSDAGSRSDSAGGPVLVRGLGMRVAFPGRFSRAKATFFDPRDDGSGVLSAEPLAGGPVTSLAVDFSRASGADVLLAMAGPGAGLKGRDVTGKDGAASATTTVKAAGRTFNIMTLQRDRPPEVRAAGDKVVVGGQTLWFDPRSPARLVLAR